jgi:glycosyltransferase involved in cell wall biosynthesis
MDKTKIAAIVFSYYRWDARVRREAESLVEAGMSVDVICLQKDGEPKEEVMNGVSVRRLPLGRKRAGQLRYMFEYFAFTLLAFAQVSMRHFTRRYDVVHVHNMPDFLVFTAFLPRLTGSKVVLDLHDPTPEVYMAKYSMGSEHPVVRLLKFVEKISIRFAHLVLTPNIAFRNLFVARGCPEEKIHIVMNSPDPAIFQGVHCAEQGSVGKKKNILRLMYHGTVVERHGLQTALEALPILKEHGLNLIFDVYGEGDYVETFVKLAKEKKLTDSVFYHGHVRLDEIPQEIAKCDIGLIPNMRTEFTEINFPTRIFEYLCMGKSVIAPRTRGILDYFDEQSIHFFEPGNANSLAETILRAWQNPEECEEVLNRGQQVYHTHRWVTERPQFCDLFAKLSV